MSKSHERGNPPTTRRLPSLYALCAFETTTRYVFFIHASEELAITQSVVSWYIRTLGEHLDYHLFEYHNRQSQPTEPARLLLPGLRDSFDALERACTALRVDDTTLRLKMPSTLTLRWLLPCLSHFRHLNLDIEVQLTSARVDVDSVDFQHEPFDCTVLLGSSQFNPGWEIAALFAERLVPVCDPDEIVEPWVLQYLRGNELLYPAPNHRGWRRQLQRTGLGDGVPLRGSQIFDTLELGVVTATQNYGVSIGDLVMIAEDVAQDRIGLSWPMAVASGENYHLVWPRACREREHFR